MDNHRITIAQEKCVGCGICADVCAAHNIKLVDTKAETVLDDCVFCGHCTAVCPQEAITVSGYDEKPIGNRGLRLDPDEVLEVIRFRRSIRRFKQKEIPNEIIGKIIEAGRLTHTGKNMQDVSFVVLDKEKARVESMAVCLFRKIKPIADLVSPLARNNVIDEHFFFFDAPIAIVILAKDKTNGILAAQNMEFVAEAYGLGVLYSGFFTISANFSRRIKKAIDMPRGKKAAMTLVLGYPDVRFLRSVQRKKAEVNYI